MLLQETLTLDSPWRPGLTVRIVVFIAAIVALFGVLTVLIIGSIVTSQLRERYASDRQTSIEFLTASLVPMVELGDYDRVERTIESVLVYENIVSLAVYDADGVLIRSASEPGDANLPTDTISHILTQGNETVGRVDIGFSRAYIDIQVNELTRILALAVTAILLATALALLWYVTRSVVRPLRIFTRTVRSMTSDNLGLRVPLRSSDEIGVLAGSFNAMAQDLEESNRQLKEANSQLEERVLERAAREERRTEQVRRIFEMRQQLIQLSGLPEMLHFVVSALQQAFSYYRVNVYLVEPDSGALQLTSAAVSPTEGNRPDQGASPANDIVGDVLSSGRPLLATEVAHEPGYMPEPGSTDTRAELAVPIAIGTLRLGVLDIQSNREGGLDEMDLFTAQTVADQIASVVESARVAVETRELTMLDERNRMAREIHDTLAQGFTGIVLQLEAAEQSLPDSPASTAAHIDRARKLARESLAEARRSVWALRPTVLERRTVADALRSEVRSLQDEGQLEATFAVSGSDPGLHTEIEEALLRVCQESLTNVRRHANATAVEVRLEFENDRVKLTIRDNGAGFDRRAVKQGCFGLLGIDERAHRCGGTAHVSSAPGEGTLVEIDIPATRKDCDE